MHSYPLTSASVVAGETRTCSVHPNIRARCPSRALFEYQRLSGKGVGGASGRLPRVAVSHGTMRRLRLAVGEEVLLLPEHSAQTRLGAGEAVADGEDGALPATLHQVAQGGALCSALAWPSSAAGASTICIGDATRDVLGLADGSLVVVCRRSAVDALLAASASPMGLPQAARLILAPVEDEGWPEGVRDMTTGRSSRAVAAVLVSQLIGRVVCSGLRVPVSLHGRPLVLLVTKVDSPAAHASEGHCGGLSVVTRDTAVTLAAAATVEQLQKADSAGQQDSSMNGSLSSSEAASGERGQGGAREEGREADGGQLGMVLKEVGGCEGAARALVDALRGGLQLAHEYEAMGLEPPRGVLLFGPPGTGKTLLARTAATALGAQLLCVDAPELVGGAYGDSERRIAELFGSARAAPATVLFIDEIDVVCGHRSSAAGEMERRIVASLIHHLDGLGGSSGSRNAQGGGRVVLVAATNRPDAVDSALRQPGRLDLEVEVGVPNAIGRRQILDLLLMRVPCCATEEDRHAVASTLHGCVGADIKLAVNTAVASALRRTRPSAPGAAAELAGNEGDDGRGSGWVVEGRDLIEAGKKVRPSALRETVVEVPQVKWTDIGGQAEAKAALQEAVEWPLRFPEAFQALGIRPPAGVLLYGPPGCSKTLMAKALATEARLNFLAVKGPELFRKYVGDSEKAVAAVFRKARVAAPAVIFFDEIDALAPRRSASGEGSAGQRVVSQLLNEMDGVEPLRQVVVVAATNRPDLLDAAFLRPGRIDRLIYVEPPDLEARKQVLAIHLRNMPLASDVDLDSIAAESDGLSGAELANLCREAGLEALAKDADVVDMAALRQALASSTPRITPEMLAFYHAFKTSKSLSI